MGCVSSKGTAAAAAKGSLPENRPVASPDLVESISNETKANTNVTEVGRQASEEGQEIETSIEEQEVVHVHASEVSTEPANVLASEEETSANVGAEADENANNLGPAVSVDSERILAEDTDSAKSVSQILKGGETVVDSIDKAPGVSREVDDDRSNRSNGNVISINNNDESDTKGGVESPEVEAKSEDGLDSEQTEILNMLAEATIEDAKKLEPRESETLSVKEKAALFASGKLSRGPTTPRSDATLTSSYSSTSSSVRAIAAKYSNGSMNTPAAVPSSSNGERMQEVEQVTRRRKSSATMAHYWNTKEEVERIVVNRKEF